MTRLAIIGTAGPRTGEGGSCEDASKMSKKMTKKMFAHMVEEARKFIGDRDLSSIDLVSGGAAWADHVAVQLFLDGGFRSLTLHIPTEFVVNAKGNKFLDTNGKRDWRTNPGWLANKCHESFSLILGHNTCDDISMAIQRGAKITVHSGFHARNTCIARSCDMMIAFSWASGSAPTSGGTYYTWSKCHAPTKYHYSLTHS